MLEDSIVGVDTFRAAHPGVQLKLHNVTGRDGLRHRRALRLFLAEE